MDQAPASEEPVAVLVADPDEARGKQTVCAVESWGLTSVLVRDGVEAMLAIQRMMPQVVVLDAGLPKMFGFQVCEVVKRNESLRHINVVLVGTIHHQDRYRRGPSDLYGADVYLEQPDLPDGLMPLLRGAGLSVPSQAPARQAPQAPSHSANPAAIPDPAAESGIAPKADPAPLEFVEDPSSTASPAPEAAPAPTPAAAPAPAAITDEDPERAIERERAERLARIAVSEMLLYQPEKFDQAIRDGNVEAVLDLEIGEARALIRQRISEEVRAEQDFILVELERVARERGGAV